MKLETETHLNGNILYFIHIVFKIRHEVFYTYELFHEILYHDDEENKCIQGQFPQQSVNEFLLL